MGVKTSVYLPEDLNARFRASGVPLGEIVRAGLDALEDAPLDERPVRAAVSAAVRDAHDDMYASVEELLDRIVSRKLAEARGESW